MGTATELSSLLPARFESDESLDHPEPQHRGLRRLLPVGGLLAFVVLVGIGGGIHRRPAGVVDPTVLAESVPGPPVAPSGWKVCLDAGTAITAECAKVVDPVYVPACAGEGKGAARQCYKHIYADYYSDYFKAKFGTPPPLVPSDDMVFALQVGLDLEGSSKHDDLFDPPDVDWSKCSSIALKGGKKKLADACFGKIVEEYKAHYKKLYPKKLSKGKGKK